MRKIFQLGGPLGATFNSENIDLSFFENREAGFMLPDGKYGELQTMEVVFHKPDFSNPMDYGAHRASLITMLFIDENNKEQKFEINGVYFWKFLESVPESFRILSEDNTQENYINESLDLLMKIARDIYQTSFIETTFENICPPPVSCIYNFKYCTFSIQEALVIPEEELKIISKLVSEKISHLDIDSLTSSFIDEMLSLGYIKRDYIKEGDHLRPDFSPATWSSEKHKEAKDYLIEMSPHQSENCPAYLSWLDIMMNRIKKEVSEIYDVLFDAESINEIKNIPTAKEIVNNGGNLFEMKGSAESTDKVYSLMKSLIEKHINSLKSIH